MSGKKKILSGMRPTGKLHLGHLAGTLDNWIRLQEEYDCFFMVADWHALMGEYENPKAMAAAGLDNVIDWISFGIDPERSTLFIQSQVPEHLELFMIFSCLTPLGWLERCPTYKEQLREVTTRDLHTYGFLGYPVLQAADILLYRANKVPVGEDQLPHLELTREIARRFNSLYKKEIFTDPEAILTKTPRLPGLDGRKMSKSYNNTINLSDSAQDIAKKVQTMITDPGRVKLSDKGNPAVCTVFSYYGVFAGEAVDEVKKYCSEGTAGCTQCKKQLAERIAKRLEPFQERRRQLEAEPGKIKAILEEGRKKAAAAAKATLAEVKTVLGL